MTLLFIHMNLNYTYVLIKNASDYYRLNYSDIIGRDDVVYIDRPVAHLPKIVQTIHKFHNSMKLNKLIPLPFKSLWYPAYCKPLSTKTGPFCFIIDASVLSLTPYMYGFVLFLKNRYPSSKFVLFYQDLIRLCPVKYRPDNMRDIFDLLISYDNEEALHYSIEYHPTVASANTVSSSLDVPVSDVFLLAKAKNRVGYIKKIHSLLSQAGFRCEFFVTDCPKSQRESKSGIHYVDSHMAYRKNLEYVMKTKCILEVMQDKAVGYTLRLWEAILYNKKLLTNNQEIKNSPYYDSHYIYIIPNSGDMSTIIDFIKDEDPYENAYKELISPISFLKFVSERI